MPHEFYFSNLQSENPGQRVMMSENMFEMLNLFFFKYFHKKYNNITNSLFILTRLKTLVRSIKAMYRSIVCFFFHFSNSTRTEKIILMVES